MRPLLSLLVLAPLPALADVTVVAPVFDRIAAFALPDGFASAFEDAQPGFYIHESVPAGETVDAWSQMITLTAAAAPGLSAEAAAQSIGAGYGDACAVPLTAIAIPPEGATVPGAEGPIFLGYVGCGQVAATGQSEEMAFVVAVAADTVYSLQWAARGPALDQAIEPDGDLWTPRLAALMGGLRLCLPVAGEAAPYPSCTGG